MFPLSTRQPTLHSIMQIQKHSGSRAGPVCWRLSLVMWSAVISEYQIINIYRSWVIVKHLFFSNIFFLENHLTNETTLHFSLMVFFLLPVFPSVFAVIYIRGIKKKWEFFFLWANIRRGAMIAVCISLVLYLSPIILMDDHCKERLQINKSPSVQCACEI